MVSKKPKIVLRIRKYFDRSLHTPVRILRILGFTANHITFLQLPFNLIMLYFLLHRSFLIAATFLGIVLFLDVFDGIFARLTKTTSRIGHIYDKALDLISIFMLLGGLLFVFPNLKIMLLLLVFLNILIYWTNTDWKPDIYCGIRAFGFLGLLFVQYLVYFLLASLVLGIVLIFLKVVIKHVKK